MRFLSAARANIYSLAQIAMNSYTDVESSRSKSERLRAISRALQRKSANPRLPAWLLLGRTCLYLPTSHPLSELSLGGKTFRSIEWAADRIFMTMDMNGMDLW